MQKLPISLPQNTSRISVKAVKKLPFNAWIDYDNPKYQSMIKKGVNEEEALAKLDKNIFEEAPNVADPRRQDYVDGINAFIKRMNDEGKDKRKEFMPPVDLANNPEKYRSL